MRPIRLRLEGFTSFRQAVELDFSKLDLFAITGPTGAGKTSLIDGLVYALYGRTPRIGEKSIVELISQGAPKMSVLLDFQSGGKTWRVVRNLKRGASTKVQVECQEGDKWIPQSGSNKELQNQLEQIVGLDFSGFTKAVVLPQGDFDRFLRGDTAERRQILSDLLNLKIYEDMKKAANSEAARLGSECALLSGQLTREYADATEENRQALEAEIAEASRDLEAKAAVLETVKAALQVALEVRQRRAESARHESARKAALDGLEKAKADAAGARKRVDAHAARLAELDRRIGDSGYDEALHLKLSGLLPKAQRRETVLANKERVLAEKAKAGVERQAALGKAAKARENSEAAEKSANDAERCYRNLEGSVAMLQEKYGSPGQLTSAANDLRGLDPDRQELEKVERELASKEESHANLRDGMEELAAADRLAAEAVERAETALEHVRALHAAGEMRRHLQAGQPCPVCEQVVSAVPKKPAAAVVDQAREALKKAKENHDRSRKSLQAAEIQLQAFPGQIEAARRHAGALATAMRRTETRAEQLLGAPLDEGACGRLQELATDFAAREKEAKQALNAWEKSRKAAAGSKDTATAADHAADKLRDQMRAMDDHARRLEDELLQLEDELAGAGDSAEIEARFQAQQAAKAERDEGLHARSQEEARRKQAESELERNNTNVAVLADRIRQSEAAIDAAQQDLRKLDQALKKKLASIELPAGSDEADSLQRLQTAVDKEHRKLTEGHIQRQARLDQLKRRIVEAEERRARLADLTASQQLHAQMGALLQANQFVRYLLEEAFERLCAGGARQLMTLSGERYSFASENDQFFVVDHWNAGERRSVNTLSGGESFLASLALALALAESIADFRDDGHSGLDSLFLDEGFSTLDSETLNIVVEAIEILQQDDRLIGVISHVSELADRLPARIQVVKSVGGSRLLVEEVAAGNGE
jgi:DNA repair protein SbcC/Rad50